MGQVIRMYHTILGQEGFRKGMDLYFKRHDGHAVTCDAFRAAMAEANNFDFTQFERWYLQSGTPVVTLTSAKYDEKTKEFIFTLRQRTPSSPKQPEKLPLHIPVKTGLIGRTSLTEIAPSKIFHFTKADQEFKFENVMENPVLSIFRDFSAPMKYIDPEIVDDDLALLMGYDTDSFIRWDAGQKLMLDILVDRANKIRDGTMEPSNPPPLKQIVIDAFRQVLNQKDSDMSFKAYALSFPMEEIISIYMRPCDPLAIHQARHYLK